ncbi:hypothetical protein NQ156_02935 [Microbacterium sp. zg.Y625]|uniref:hypothetical protein n=1 Tax=Microbacterium jiangjiandongii TaxID=3049071 RepID=UPI00214AC484|nr:MULTISPECIES: hypothetical protein [unclassified Microbacterium]MCR2792011.1 hypothetical protein [Microbacterium sp. zg.Y625]WIM24818.1 hypothetical protein QNO14_11845 [Microbacterium sp. zg-Y625]
MDRRRTVRAVVFPILILWWVFTGLFIASFYGGPAAVGEERACIERHVELGLDRTLTVEGSWQLFPLGLTCSFTRPSGEQVVYGPDMVPTALLVTGIVLTVVGAVALIVSHRDPERQQQRRVGRRPR